VVCFPGSFPVRGSIFFLSFVPICFLRGGSVWELAAGTVLWSAGAEVTMEFLIGGDDLSLFWVCSVYGFLSL